MSTRPNIWTRSVGQRPSALIVQLTRYVSQPHTRLYVGEARIVEGQRGEVGEGDDEC